MTTWWWFDQGNQPEDEPAREQPPETILSWHQLDRAKVVKRLAEQRGEHANRSGRYLVRWEARYAQRWRLTLWEPSELAELDHGAA